MRWEYLHFKYKDDDDGSGEIKEWRGGAGDFAKEIIGLRLLPHQKIFLDIKGFFLWVWNNRGGKK